MPKSKNVAAIIAASKGALRSGTISGLDAVPSRVGSCMRCEIKTATVTREYPRSGVWRVCDECASAMDDWHGQREMGACEACAINPAASTSEYDEGIGVRRLCDRCAHAVGKWLARFAQRIEETLIESPELGARVLPAPDGATVWEECVFEIASSYGESITRRPPRVRTPEELADPAVVRYRAEKAKRTPDTEHPPRQANSNNGVIAPDLGTAGDASVEDAA